MQNTAVVTACADEVLSLVCNKLTESQPRDLSSTPTVVGSEGRALLPQNALCDKKDDKSTKLNSEGFSCTDIFDFDSFDGVDLLSFVKQHNSTLNFPEKLMLMLTHVEREYAKTGRKTQEACISWVPNGLAFVIRDKDALVKNLLPLFFGQSKFTSFTRKLYRWGFKQFSRLQNQGINRGDICFSNAFFQRDNKAIISKMQSVTAARNRKGGSKHKALIATTTTTTLARNNNNVEHKEQEQQQQRQVQDELQQKQQQQEKIVDLNQKFVITTNVTSGDFDKRGKGCNIDQQSSSASSNSLQQQLVSMKVKHGFGPLPSPLIPADTLSKCCRTHVMYENNRSQRGDQTCSHDMMLAKSTTNLVVHDNNNKAETYKSKSLQCDDNGMSSIYEAVDILLHFASAASASRNMTETA